MSVWLHPLKQVARRLPPFARLVRDRDRLQSELDHWKRWQAFPPGHFYSPIPDLTDVRARRAAVFDRTRREIPGIDLRWAQQLDLLRELSRYYGELPFPEEPAADRRYYFQNDAFCHADAILLYGMLRRLRPRRVVEVGSGYSSCAMLDTADRFLQGETRFTFIDPYPERLCALLKPEDHGRARLIRTDVQRVDVSLFAELQANDVLFIDSSHVAKTGSDVAYLVFEVIPRLAPGVYVHFHDVFYPFEYPAEWVLRGWTWNEAYLVRAFLQFNRQFEIALWGTAIAEQYPDVLAELMPLAVKNTGGSLWLRRAPEIRPPHGEDRASGNGTEAGAP